MTNPLPSLPEVQSRTEVVTRVIREAILSQRMRSGETLVERRIADDLGVSKTPVREALIALQQSGLVTTGANRRLAVVSLNAEDVAQIYEMRIQLEAWAFRHAKFDEATLARAEGALERAQQAWKSDNEIDQVLANREFHRALYSTCQNQFIIRALDRLQDMTALAITTVLWAERAADPIVEHEEHREILRAASEGDLDRGAKLLSEHIYRSVEGKTSVAIRLENTP